MRQTKPTLTDEEVNILYEKYKYRLTKKRQSAWTA